ncbi:hypothetical protein RTBOTA2_006375 [Rhodotorula toruloides]|nr:hypothetical protein RTBOTA2_006375 [Rhodotorula toruloides]
MKTVAYVASALALAGLASAQTINTPTALYTCEPYQLSWAGGSAPYYVRVLQGGTTSDVIETLVSAQSVTSYTWNVNVPAGSSVTIGLTDSTGQSAYTAQVTVQAGSSTSCVGQSASGAAGGAAGSSTAAAAGSSSAAGSSAAASSAASTTGGARSSASSAASSGASAASSGASAASPSQSSKPSSGAATLAVSGLVGAAGVAAALLA